MEHVKKATNANFHMIFPSNENPKNEACMMTKEMRKKVSNLLGEVNLKASFAIYFNTLHVTTLLSETMDDWDQDTLEEVIKKKHGASNTIKTEIVCLDVLIFNFLFKKISPDR